MPKCTVYIIDGAGQCLAEFDYSGGLPENTASEFRTRVLETGHRMSRNASAQQGAFLRVDDAFSLVHIRKGGIYLVGGVLEMTDHDRMLKALIKVEVELKHQLSDMSPASIVNNRTVVKEIVDSIVAAAESA